MVWWRESVIGFWFGFGRDVTGSDTGKACFEVLLSLLTLVVEIPAKNTLHPYSYKLCTC